MMLNTGMGLLAVEAVLALRGCGEIPPGIKEKFDAVGAILSHLSLDKFHEIYV